MGVPYSYSRIPYLTRL